MPYLIITASRSFFFFFLMHVQLSCLNFQQLMLCSLYVPQEFREIIESSGESRHLSTIPLKNFHLFKIAESIINFYLKNFLTNNFKHVEVF